MANKRPSSSPGRALKGKNGRRPSRKSLLRAGKRVIKVSLGVIAISAIVFLGKMAYNSSFFKVSQVTVLGVQQLEAAQVIEATDLLGSHILDLDRDQLVQSLEEWPLVKSATVKWKPPNEVVITIEERQPAALWQVRDSKYLVDDEGFVLNEAPLSGPLPEICIIHLDGQPLEPGNQVDSEAIHLAYKLTETLPPTLGAKAQRFEYLSHGGLVVVTDKGWRARFGDMDDFDFKLAVWKELLAKAPQLSMKPQHVDLRFATRPFYRQ
jgi:cell division protein FtsQ